MTDFPLQPFFFSPTAVISPYSAYSVGNMVAGITSSGAYPVANRAFFIPFRLSAPYQIIRGFVVNAGTVSGNFDMGVYGSDGKKIVTKGSTAQTGTSQIQQFTLTSTWIGPGVFYLALILDNTTGIFYNSVPTQVGFCQAIGMAQWDTTIPLGDATLASIATAYIPHFGISNKSLV